MRITGLTAAALLGGALIFGCGSVAADEANACAHFSWDVTHELAVMKQSPQALTAAVAGTGTVPQMRTGQVYEVKLAPQGSVGYLVPPGKAMPAAQATGGLVLFRVPVAGRYRISLASGHWIDVLANGAFIKSRDFQGAHGCEPLHKIVEFELPADQSLTLQFSGAPGTSVRVAITAVTSPAAQ